MTSSDVKMAGNNHDDDFCLSYLQGKRFTIDHICKSVLAKGAYFLFRSGLAFIIWELPIVMKMMYVRMWIITYIAIVVGVIQESSVSISDIFKIYNSNSSKSSTLSPYFDF